jgi:hypothetical protein
MTDIDIGIMSGMVGNGAARRTARTAAASNSSNPMT